MTSERHAAGRRQIIEEFWDNAITDVQRSEIESSTYFEYFQEQYRLARQNDEPQCPIYTLRNLCHIVHQFKTGRSRNRVKADISLKYMGRHSDDLINHVIDLAVRLWLMVHIGNVGGNVRRMVTGHTAIVWRESCLKDMVDDHFCHQVVLTDSVKFEKVFNALNLERIAGIIIQWTPNLVDHLRLKEDGKKPVLNIFHHAAFLNYHANW